ncbi:MAG: bifunctional glutamate N-acetyltransferase/amino-acid acetyltransferase ArgJ [Planctomycetaceae bacterium]|nr:bifunctional glutamate N-acetyltransferase/amino-acid acetyltransferase ArgJ [Planctomycetaceae bacterium]
MTILCPLPAGFQTAATACGVKNAGSDKLDLALFVSDRPATAAGVFTTNLVCGAPVKVSRERLPRPTARAVVINSGNSNACTGDQGLADARAMTERVAKHLGCAGEDVLVCSTGVIGRPLPMDRLNKGIDVAAPKLSSSAEDFLRAAQAMMTTDTVSKQAHRLVMVGGKSVHVSGVCKGAAMIAPNMATMLGVIMTDARLTTDDAARILRAAVADSFNCISVDGHESTSDSVILLANGAAGVEPEHFGDRQAFEQAVTEVAAELAQAIIRDAEGASHFVTIDVQGARSREEAHRIAKSVADSPLVKTAICGADPNWGRIVSAVGYAGIPMREEDISLTVNGISLYERGQPVPFDEKAASTSMRSRREVDIVLTLTLGEASIRYWTSDLTKEYVELNADYTT